MKDRLRDIGQAFFVALALVTFGVVIVALLSGSAMILRWCMSVYEYTDCPSCGAEVAEYGD